jgi:dolichol-phosphate mannosyltransferase
MILQHSQPEITVLLPAHNEADNLPTLVGEIDATLRVVGRSYEILVINDGSRDRTAEVLQELALQYPAVVIGTMHAQSGQSAALAAGFDLARGEYVVTMDADLQNDPADIPKLLAELRQHDVAIGWRRDRKDPFSKKIISKVANFIRNWFTGECVKDTGCGLKARRECVERIHRFDGMHRFFPTLVKMYGYTVAEVPVNHRPRMHGRTHYNILNRSLRPMADLLAVRWLQKRTLRYQVHQEKVLVKR